MTEKQKYTIDDLYTWRNDINHTLQFLGIESIVNATMEEYAHLMVIWNDQKWQESYYLNHAEKYDWWRIPTPVQVILDFADSRKKED